MISVVIPAFNAASTIDRQLASLARQTYRGRWEVIIADNGSTDDTRTRIDAWTEQIPILRVVDASDVSGANHARNVGASAARGDFLLFCDADDEAARGWVEAMASAATEHDLLGGAIDVERLNTARVRGWVEQTQWERLPRVLDFLPYSLSANLGIWRDVMEDLGGWTEAFTRPAGDDVDLCWRAQLNSYRLGFQPAAVMHYKYRDRLRPMARQHFGYGAAEPLLYKRFKEHGFERPSAKDVLANYVRLAKDIPYLITRPHMRGIWIRKVAHHAGRLSGSIKNRVVFL
jgi:glycosyltransferase involved in cell wall biosynthesis